MDSVRPKEHATFNPEVLIRQLAGNQGMDANRNKLAAGENQNVEILIQCGHILKESAT